MRNNIIIGPASHRLVWHRSCLSSNHHTTNYNIRLRALGHVLGYLDKQGCNGAWLLLRHNLAVPVALETKFLLPLTVTFSFIVLVCTWAITINLANCTPSFWDTTGITVISSIHFYPLVINALFQSREAWLMPVS
ncbi:hypothetical protein BJ165DRAFT_718625 [Panaeolus papilionaceus]|nr:hypothetical protein BJ165DRAFT_718625 [Panaeolus papilionaceus]